jgi:hypothetical protein
MLCPLTKRGRSAAAPCVPVIARTFLAPFDCSGSHGVYTMDADPSIRCDDGNPTHRRMVVVALVSIGLYGLGVPAGFLWILTHFREGGWRV